MDAQVDLSLRWTHMSVGTLSHVATLMNGRGRLPLQSKRIGKVTNIPMASLH